MEQTHESRVDDECDEFEDDDEVDECGTCFVIDHVATFRSNLVASMCRNKNYIRAIILSLLVLLYFAYFIYALHYKFGDEASIRLLWVTCLVVVILALSLLQSFLRPHFKSITSSKPIIFLSQNHRQINWYVVAVSHKPKIRSTIMMIKLCFLVEVIVSIARAYLAFKQRTDSNKRFIIGYVIYSNNKVS